MESKKEKRHGGVRNIFKDAWYYLNPKNLSIEMKDYGYPISPIKLLVTYIVVVLLCVGLGYAFKLHKASLSIIIVFGIFFTPLVFRNIYKNKYEQQRFSDITEYMEQILYSFKANHKILTALSEVQHEFSDGPMYRTLDKAIKTILSCESLEAEKEGLRIIEREYSNDKLRTIHRFLLKVETIGGEFNSTIDVLLEDRSMWVDRQNILQKSKKTKLIEILIAVGMTLGICWMVLSGLPDNVDISRNIMYQIVTAAVIVSDIVICIIGFSSITTDYLDNKKAYSSEKLEKDYNFVATYDKSKAFKMSLPMFIFPVIMVGIGIIFKTSAYCFVAVIFGFIIVVKPGLDYSTARRRLKREANLMFPRWLMEIALQLQSTSVTRAILNSITTAPLILRPALDRFAIEEALNPYSVSPYNNFMKDFEIKEISSSMKMLYSIASGTGGDAETQITDIIKRNNHLMDKSEKIDADNKLAGLHTLIMAAEATGGAKLLVDMILFMILFMGSSMTLKM